MAFERETRRDIRRRAGFESELSSINNRPLECSHLDHSRYHDSYNFPDNGVLVTDIEHYAYHQIFKLHPYHIGLSKDDNYSALCSIYQRILDFNKQSCIEMSEDQIDSEINKAKDYWFLYLGIES